MRVVNHNDGCAGVPNDGRLSGRCDCVSAPLTLAANDTVDKLIAAFEKAANLVGEDHEYTALRFDGIAELFEKAAHTQRMRARKVNRAGSK